MAQDHTAAQQAQTQQPAAKPSPIPLLLTWSGKKGLYALSAALAIIGVAGTMVPYIAAGNIISGIVSGTTQVAFFLHWLGIAALGYVFYLVFHFASTIISHLATFATISRVRERLAQKLVHVPMGYVLDTPSGTLNLLWSRRSIA